MDYELNEDQELLLKQLTHKIKLVDEKISKSKDYEKEVLEEEKMVYQKNLDDLRFGALLIHYIKLDDEQKIRFQRLMMRKRQMEKSMIMKRNSRI